MFFTPDTFHRDWTLGGVWMVASENKARSYVFTDTNDENYFIGYPWDKTDSFILF